ncbi:MAG: hypothetical protein KDB35_09405 [Acidimicrobiales bacterium]|nr:hypothetical protein [Acidimicrobiales bacterium]MCB9372324.1 hypothetical protein [Microthrixaceae bacterium]
MSTSAPGEIVTWLADRLPRDWFDDQPSVRVDREEILVVGPLRVPDADGDDPVVVERQRCIAAFREETRSARMAIAAEAEVVWGRKVSWGVRCGDAEEHFTTVSTPVMTRLRMEERDVLDTLIEAGVARSRSEALAWCVRLVGHHEADWIESLRDAVATIKAARAAGPQP